MSETEVTAARAAHDRRQRAWAYFVLGLLAVWIGWGVMAADSLWQYLGWAMFLGGVTAVTFGVVLFQKPRP